MYKRQEHRRRIDSALNIELQERRENSLRSFFCINMIFLPIITLRKDEKHMKSKTEKIIRRFEISLAAAFVITSIFRFVSFAASCSDVRRDVLRMHVIANSDSDEDQILKLKAVSYTHLMCIRDRDRGIS